MAIFRTNPFWELNKQEFKNISFCFGQNSSCLLLPSLQQKQNKWRVSIYNSLGLVLLSYRECSFCRIVCVGELFIFFMISVSLSTSLIHRLCYFKPVLVFLLLSLTQFFVHCSSLILFLLIHCVATLALQNIPEVLLALNLAVGPYSSLKSTRESTNSLELVELNYLPFFVSRFWINCGLDTQGRWDEMRYLIYCRSCHTGAGARGRTKYSFLQSFPWIYHTVQEDLLENCSHFLLVQVWGPWTALEVEQWIMILLGGLVESLEMTLSEDLEGGQPIQFLEIQWAGN